MPYLITWTDESGQRHEAERSSPENLTRKLRRARLPHRLYFREYGSAVLTPEAQRVRRDRWTPNLAGAKAIRAIAGVSDGE